MSGIEDVTDEELKDALGEMEAVAPDGSILRPLYVLRRVKIPWSKLKKFDIFCNEKVSPGDTGAREGQWQLAKTDSFPEEAVPPMPENWGVQMEDVHLIVEEHERDKMDRFEVDDIPKDGFRERVKDYLLNQPVAAAWQAARDELLDELGVPREQRS